MSDRDLDKSSNKFVNWCRQHIITIVLIFISIYFVFSGSFKFIRNDMDTWSEVCYLASEFIFGLTISSLLGETGYSAAKETEEFQETRRTAIEFCEKALPKHKEAELYVSKLIDEDIRQERLEILNKASVWYDEIFDENASVLIDKKELVKTQKYTYQQKRAIRKAVKIKKVAFTLFGFSSVKTVGRKEAPSEQRRRNKKIVGNVISKVLITFVSGSIMISFIGISISSMIYACFQLLIWFGAGVITRIGNYNFIMNDVRDYDKDRIWYLKKFLALETSEIDNLTKEVSEKEACRVKIKRIEMK